MQDLIEKGAVADLEAASALLRDYGAALDAEQRQRDAAIEALRELVTKQARCPTLMLRLTCPPHMCIRLCKSVICVSWSWHLYVISVGSRCLKGAVPQ